MKTITITDNGIKTTSELLKDIGCLYFSYLSDEELDKQFPPVKTERKFLWTQEADEEQNNKSANDLKQEEQITLRERLIFEKMWFEEKGTHLDVDNITLCAGSRYAGGDVPRVRWGGDELVVGWADPGDRDGFLRARAVVSLNSSVPLSLENRIKSLEDDMSKIKKFLII